MKRKKLSRTGLIFILLVTAAVIVLTRHFHIADFCTVKPRVLYTSGQPRGMDYFRLLYRYHITTIVNIRQVSEHREDNWHTEEIIWTRRNGVNYVEMPIDKGTYFPDKRTQDEFLAIMAHKKNLPVLLHGSADDKRVAMLVAAWLERAQGCTPEQTVEVVQKIIDDRDLTEQENEFIRLLAK